MKNKKNCAIHIAIVKNAGHNHAVARWRQVAFSEYFERRENGRARTSEWIMFLLSFRNPRIASRIFIRFEQVVVMVGKRARERVCLASNARISAAWNAMTRRRRRITPGSIERARSKAEQSIPEQFGVKPIAKDQIAQTH